MTRKPYTEDFVPVLPWLGVMLWGLAAGQWLLQHRRGVLAGAVPAALQPLALLGRWSLSFYMLHQPVFIGFADGLGGAARVERRLTCSAPNWAQAMQGPP